jgi:hypothetical protein
MFGFKKKIELAENKVAVQDTSNGKINPVVGLINEDIREFNNSMNSYYADSTFTDNMVDTILLNPHVRSKLNLKLNKALAFNGALSYEGAKKAVSKYIESDFMTDFKWRELARQIMYSRYYGKAVIRVYWNENDEITHTRNLDHRLFTYNNDYALGDIGDLMYNQINLTKKYPYNFIVIYNEVDAKYPFGKSDLRELYPTIMTYNLFQGIEARFMNKAVIPAYVASYESTATGNEALKAESDMISSVLSQIENGSGVGIANLKSLYTLQENGQVNFNSCFERLRTDISITILGSDMTDSKKNGTYAQAKASTEYIDGNVKDLAIDIQNTANELIKWQVWALWGVDYVAPRYIYDMQEPYDLEVIKFQVENGFAVSARQASKMFALPSSYVFPEDDIWRPDPSLMPKKEEPKTTDTKDEDSTPDDSDDVEPDNTDDK